MAAFVIVLVVVLGRSGLRFEDDDEDEYDMRLCLFAARLL
jgi:hypothetical protein